MLNFKTSGTQAEVRIATLLETKLCTVRKDNDGQYSSCTENDRSAAVNRLYLDQSDTQRKTTARSTWHIKVLLSRKFGHLAAQ